MEYVASQTKADSQKMQSMIDLASRNPTQFLESLPQQYKDKIKKLAEKSELRKNSP